MYYFWFDYVKPKYREKSKSCYMDTDNFIVYVKQKTLSYGLQEMLKQDLILQVMN